MKYLKKILLIDDEVDYLHLLTIMLRRQGFDVYSITNGHQVSDTIKTFKPDMILLDVRLGNLDGKALCKQLKSDPATNNIKIILHSAFPSIENEYQLCGADDFVLKPTDVPDLVGRINKQL
jgi:DNA-binding response OmpR family regulator